MSFWRKAFQKDEDLPPPIERRRKPPVAEENRPPIPSSADQEAQPQPASDAETTPSVLAAGLQVEGTLQGHGTVRVEGAFHGEVRLDGTLVVAPGGRVQGEVLVARRIIVEGLVRGPLLAEYVEIGATGRVWGDVTTTAFVTREGGFLRGQVRMEERLDLPLTPTHPEPADRKDETGASQPAPADDAPAPTNDEEAPPRAAAAQPPAESVPPPTPEETV